VPQIQALAGRCLAEYYPPDAFWSAMSDWPSGQLAACDGRAVAGFLCGARKSGSVATVALLAVDERMRGRGIGSALLGAFLEAAFGEGFSVVDLEARADDQRAISFYEGRGFARAELRPMAYADGSDAVCMAICGPPERRVGAPLKPLRSTGFMKLV
jgi:ribosomal-protein-alanine N-acetyltransferase